MRAVVHIVALITLTCAYVVLVAVLPDPFDWIPGAAAWGAVVGEIVGKSWEGS